jgi:hypothetical protein
MIRWARDYDACRQCGSDRRPHHARGYCRPCYGAEYRAATLVGTNAWAFNQWIIEEGTRRAEQELQELVADEAYALLAPDGWASAQAAQHAISPQAKNPVNRAST